MLTQSFSNETGILTITLLGIIPLSEVVEYITEVRENKTYPRRLKILTDASRAEFAITEDELIIIGSENIKTLEHYQYIMDAIIIENAIDTAMWLLFQEAANTMKYRIKVFSTRESAYNWLSSH